MLAFPTVAPSQTRTLASRQGPEGHVCQPVQLLIKAERGYFLTDASCGVAAPLPLHQFVDRKRGPSTPCSK